MFSVKPAGASVSTPEIALRFSDLVMLTVGNGPWYGGGFRGAPDARLDDGLLDCYAFRDVPGLCDVDRSIEVLLAELEALGLAQTTIVVFTADHGEMLGDHWFLGKDGYYDPAFRVPMIVKPPSGGARGAVVDEFTEHVDVMPTLCDLMELPLPPEVTGHSLLPHS